MVSTYTPNLGLENPAPGDQANLWGVTENEGRTIADASVAGVLARDVSGNVDVTLTSAQGTTNEWVNWVYIFSGVLTGNINVNVPDGKTKPFLVVNATTGAFSLTVKTTSGTGIEVEQGLNQLLYSDGVDVQVGLPGVVIGTTDGEVPSNALLKATGRGYTGRQYAVPVTKVFATPLTLDLATDQEAVVTVTSSFTLANPSNMVAGESGNLDIIQGGTGGYTIAYDTAWTFPNGTRPAIGTGIGVRSLLSWRCTGATMEANLNPSFS